MIESQRTNPLQKKKYIKIDKRADVLSALLPKEGDIKKGIQGVRIPYSTIVA